MKLEIDHPLFKNLINNPPLWWKNILNDKDLYIDIRKNNYINVYFNGGSLLKLEWKGEYVGGIHSKYIPLESENEYHQLMISQEQIEIGEINPTLLNNFNLEALKKIKSRIKKYSNRLSEKGIQGNYIVKNNIKKYSNGFFLDSEFMFKEGRVDLLWADMDNKLLAYVELKTIGDSRLYTSSKDDNSISSQLERYYSLIQNKKDNLLGYYKKVYQIKKNLGLIPDHIVDKSIENFSILEKPILLIGDCTQNWINSNFETINEKINDVAFGSVFHGFDTYNFHIPFKNLRNSFRLS